MKVILEYDNVTGCIDCPFSRFYLEQGWSKYFCVHPEQTDLYFVAEFSVFPKGCPMANKEVERVVK